jgi:hypothetical protein
MHIEPNIEAARGGDPEALDDQVAEMYGGLTTEEPGPSAPHARPLGEVLSYPPICAHGMNSFTDGRYDLALARLRHG